jgi:putative transcriptional regulator
MANKKDSEIVDAILDTAEGLHRIGVMDKRTYRGIIGRHLGRVALANTKPISGSEILKMRLRAKVSHASFARCFNRTCSYISRLERGTSQPKGAALVLLNVIRRKGFEAIL